MRTAGPVIACFFLLLWGISCKQKNNIPDKAPFLGTWESAAPAPNSSGSETVVRLHLDADTVRWETELTKVASLPGCHIHSFYKGTWYPACKEESNDGRLAGCFDFDITHAMRSNGSCDDPAANFAPVAFDFSGDLSLDIQDYTRFSSHRDSLHLDFYPLQRVDSACLGCNWPF